MLTCHEGNMYSPTGPNVYQASSDAFFPTRANLMLGDKFYERSKASIDNNLLLSI